MTGRGLSGGPDKDIEDVIAHLAGEMISPERGTVLKFRPRRTRAEVAQLEHQIYEVLREDHPQSVRHVFYRMTDPRLPEPVEKSDRGYAHVQHRMKEMRLAGRLPYEWVTDSTRLGYHVDTYNSAAEFLRSVAELYRADLWRHSPYYVEVWCESRSIAGIIHGECRDLAVSLYPSGGFTSMSQPYDAAQFIKATISNTGKTVVIFYIGDYDPAGVLIDRDIEAKLRLHLPAVNLEFRRIGINEDQIAACDLPTKPRKEGERRAAHVTETVEAEAMPAGQMRSLLRAEIEALLPVNMLEITKAAEESERLLLDWAADELEDGEPS